jgi:hypothetical protein
VDAEIRMTLIPNMGIHTAPRHNVLSSRKATQRLIQRIIGHFGLHDVRVARWRVNFYEYFLWQYWYGSVIRYRFSLAAVSVAMVL